jgi:hypothetical protein
MLALVAQVADPISGGAGWVGAGLLGCVLGWLLFVHLPAKDKQITAIFGHLDEATERKDKRLDEQRGEFLRTLSEMSVSFKAEAKAEREACEKHFGTLAESMNSAFKALSEQLAAHAARNQQWAEILKREIEVRQAAPKPAG